MLYAAPSFSNENTTMLICGERMLYMAPSFSNSYMGGENVLELKYNLRKEEEIGCSHASHLKIFSREWWTRKIDNPCKEMYKLIKRKQSKESIPLLFNP